jgi:hypothetical protein
MVPPDKFLDALSLLSVVARIRQQARHAWDGDVPLQLDFALVGDQLARHLLTLTDDERAYVRGVLDYGLAEGTHNLRPLVLRPLLSTLFERSRRMGKMHEAAILRHLYLPSFSESSSDCD